MITGAKVMLWGESVGAVLWLEERNAAVFEFDKKYINEGFDISPIKMPLSEARKGNSKFIFSDLSRETFKGLPGLLADSLPDRYGNKIINEWLARQGRDESSVNPVERLCFVGRRGMGALEFEPAIKPFSAGKSENLEINELLKVVNEILNEKKKVKADLKDEKELRTIIKIGTSAGGARAKAIISFNKETNKIKSGQLDNQDGYESWIIKFDGVHGSNLGDPEGYGRIEFTYYEMAKLCGINMSECRLLEENNRAHFMTKRFDRIGNDKIHLHSLCGIAHYDYNNPNVYSYEQAFFVMRNLRIPHNETEQLYRRMVFNVIARNQDDHTKNISFLMNRDGEWHLAPAYDLTYACNPGSRWTNRHQLSVNGKREGITAVNLIETAKSINVKRYKKIIDEVNQGIKSWDQLAEKNAVKEEQIREIKRNFIKI